MLCLETCFMGRNYRKRKICPSLSTSGEADLRQEYEGDSSCFNRINQKMIDSNPKGQETLR